MTLEALEDLVDDTGGISSSLPFFLRLRTVASFGVFVLFVLIEFYKFMLMLGMWNVVCDT